MASNRRVRKPRGSASRYIADDEARRNPRRSKTKRKVSRQERAERVLNARAEHIRQHGGIAVPITAVNFVIGVCLAPLLLITFLTFGETLHEATVYNAFWKEPPFWFFGLGTVLWVIFFFGFKGPQLIWTYVFGHEWTHVITTLLCGGKILEKPRISSSGGEVVTNKTNFIISLSPYFVPFYSVLVAITWLSLRFFLDPVPLWAEYTFYGVLGFTFAYHLMFTFMMVSRSQPDLKQNGWFFSMVFILLINLLILSTLFVFASDTGWRSFVLEWKDMAETIGIRCVNAMRALISGASY